MTRNEYIVETERIQRKYEVKYFRLIRNAIKAEVTAVTNAIQSGGIAAGRRVINNTLTSGIAPVIQQMYLEVGLRFARKQHRLLIAQLKRSKKGFGYNDEWVKFLQTFLMKFFIEKITFEVSENLRNSMLEVLDKGITEGWGIDKIVNAMADVPLARYRIARIVRTEITRAANTGAMAAGSTFEYEQQKEWISANDHRTRGTNPKDHANHVSLDGTTINYDDLFTDPRNGDKLRYPGDPGGNGIPPTQAGSVINCRCNIAITAKVDNNGRLIPRRQSTAVVFPSQQPQRTVITI